MTKGLEKYRQMFAEARDLTQEARKQAQIDDDYFHGYQLTAAERAVLRKRKQPDQVFNRYRAAILGTLGVLKQGRTDPRAYGRNPQDDDSSDVVSKALRFVADETEWDDKRIKCSYDYLNTTAAAVLVSVGEDNRIDVDPISWEEFFYDPRSRQEDFADARYMGIARWVYAADLKGAYDVQDSDIAAAYNLGADDTFEDRPRDSQRHWADRRHQRLLLVEMYHQEGGKWFRCVFYAGGILEQGESPYLDSKGRPQNAIIAQSCFVDRENNRYGIGRDMRGPQDEINKRRSKLLNLLNNRQVQATGPDGAMAMNSDADLVREEAARPDGVLPPGWQPISLNDMTMGQFNLLGQAYSDIERFGPNPATLGRQGENSSGRNNLIRQQAGMTELAVVLGGIEHWELRVYRAMWHRIKQYWKAPDFIRVTDDEQASEFIGINQPQFGPPQVVQNPETGMAEIQPTILGYENQLAELDIDIILDVAPDTATMAMEQFQQIMEMSSSTGQRIPLDLAIEMSSIPDKRKILEKLKGRMEQPGPAAEQAAQLEQAEKVADIKETQSKAQLNQASAQAKQVQAELDVFNAGVSAASTG